MEHFTDYGHAILSVVLYAALAQILNAMTGIRKGENTMKPGQPFEADYGNPAYRLERAYMNGLEILGIFAAITFAAILAGANAFWVNLFASGVLVIRLVYTVAYFRQLGAPYGGFRTILSVLSALCILAIAVLAVAAVFW